LAYSARDNLVVAGSELVGSDAYILYWYVFSHAPSRPALLSYHSTVHSSLFPPSRQHTNRDVRQPNQPIYTHSQTHSDDITHLSFLPPTSRLSLPLTSDTTTSTPLPPLLLLSSSTDGLVALSDAKENDEDEACWATEGLDGSVAKCGWYAVGAADVGAGMSVNVWARSDMDSLGTWSLARGEEGFEVGCFPRPLPRFVTHSSPYRQLINPRLHPTNLVKPLHVSTTTGTTSSSLVPAISDSQSLDPHPTTTADEERQAKKRRVVEVEYVVDVCPSLGVARDGVGMVACGNNEWVGADPIRGLYVF
jgi:hypothetical protein